MVKKKGKSKRVTLKDKYKIQRRVVESHRKSRKQAKRDAKAGIVRHDKKKKDPGIPNSWPFKQDLLQEISRARERAEQKKSEEKERKKEQLRALHEHQAGGGTATTLEELVSQANKSQAEFEAKQGSVLGGASDENDGTRIVKQAHGQQSRRAYLRELKKVIDSSDVLLQILDARDPIGTRIHPAVEDSILAHYDKRMVFVLNKIDLIPKDAVSGWLTALRRSHPTVALKAGTSQSRSNESGRDSGVGRAKGDSALSSTSAVGVEGLLHLLKNYARTSGETKKAKSCITVGIIGYPNVGKSSVLNTLKRSRAVGVSPRPGFTTAMQEVVLDRSIRLLDSPGVVFDDDDAGNGSQTLLRNCIDADAVDDPIPAVQGLLDRCSAESLMMTYGLPAFPKGDVMAFLALIARVKGRVLKGGIPDKVAAARCVLRDWNSGKIPYFTPPPEASMEEDETTGGESGAKNGSAKILSAFGEEFDVGKMLVAHDAEVMEGLEPSDGMDFVHVKPVVRNSHSDNATQAAVKFLTQKGNDKSVEDMMDEGSGDDNDGMQRSSAGVILSNSNMAEAEDYDFEAM